MKALGGGRVPGGRGFGRLVSKVSGQRSSRWRGLALSNEDIANALRDELQLALDTQAHFGKKEEEEEAGTSTSTERLRAPRCKGCGAAAAMAVLLWVCQ
ncbi:hypothetical protein GUJ93_ZPchr0009g1949 [Zizania palustris]|uniref:Uncharacterized protein n=1 Tax=Zizania palustris TaxID=103762 RepID=A0A8J5UXH7_ZIZPA|nr:hypothetical protein GUJ93_ZPchr0009g1949 [Zizania palustris]